MLVSEYADDLPLCCKAQMFDRQSIAVDRSSFASWVGRAALPLGPVHERLLATLKRSGKLFADETTAFVLGLEHGRTKISQASAYAHDERPWGGSDPAGVVYAYASDRTAGTQIAHLSGFESVLQVDGYAAYEVLANGGKVQLA